jgi:hypothetical protein
VSENIGNFLFSENIKLRTGLRFGEHGRDVIMAGGHSMEKGTGTVTEVDFFRVCLTDWK